MIQGKRYSAQEYELDQRRARSVHMVIRPCRVCGKNGPFGFNDFKTAPHLAVFACRDHREEVAQALE